MGVAASLVSTSTGYNSEGKGGDEGDRTDGLLHGGLPTGAVALARRVVEVPPNPVGLLKLPATLVLEQPIQQPWVERTSTLFEYVQGVSLNPLSKNQLQHRSTRNPMMDRYTPLTSQVRTEQAVSEKGHCPTMTRGGSNHKLSERQFPVFTGHRSGPHQLRPVVPHVVDLWIGFRHLHLV